MDPPFPQHLTSEQALNLKVGDRIDHCDSVGRFVPAIIEQLAPPHFNIHYIGWSRQWDVVQTYGEELHRFAREGSISKRASHRLKHLKTNDFLDINPISHPGWKRSKIRRMDNHSGQIQVAYALEDKTYLRWMHLDDVNQCDHLGSHTKQKGDDKLDHLTSYLETRHTLSNTTDHVKSESLKEIGEEIFNGIPSMIDFIVKHCDVSQLQQIQKIINQKNIKYEESLKSMENIENNNDELMEIDNNNKTTLIEEKRKISLNELSRDVIGYICGYLDRDDIALFKVISYKMCIVCLKEMRKWNVGVFNVNELINDTKKKYVDLIGFKSLDHLTYSRYIQSTPYSYIFDEWQRIYNIPKQNQLLLSLEGHVYKPPDIEETLIWQLNHRNFYLLDTRNIIILKENEAPKVMADNTENMSNKTVIFLKWFDIYFQKLTPLQLVIVDSNHDHLNVIKYAPIAKYIKDEFIATTKSQKAWHQKVISYVDDMNGEQYENSNAYKMHIEKPNEGKIVSFNVSMNPDGFFISNGMEILIFSLNRDHPSLTNSKFATVVEKYDLIKKQMYQ